MDELMIWVRMSQSMTLVPIDAPACDQTETAERPSPAPKESNMSESAAVTKAPPITAAQDTPEELASLLPDEPAAPTG